MGSIDSFYILSYICHEIERTMLDPDYVPMVLNNIDNSYRRRTCKTHLSFLELLMDLFAGYYIAFHFDFVME